MTPAAVQGLLIGLFGAVGLLVGLQRLPVFRRPTLDDRLTPYVADASPVVELGFDKTYTPFPTLERIVKPFLSRGAHRLERLLGGGGTIRRKLAQAGLGTSLQEFRVEQLLWGAAGFAIALILSIFAVGTGTSPVLMVIMCFVAFGIGVVARDQWLSRQVKRRNEKILAEFPTVAEMLALAVSAGEGPASALERVSRISHGELAKDIQLALADTRAGTPLVRALAGMGDNAGLPALSRFVDGFAVAIERGTPLADVLRAQAQDVRDVGKRELMEEGGRKEISMMVPVVFLILPVTILFAFFPAGSILSFTVN
ncbi:MAG TPA: type II secretion system F family protein [Actinopolymorphaceae bacterium]